jgi:DNA-binding NarL/FixJ family response regulator
MRYQRVAIVIGKPGLLATGLQAVVVKSVAKTQARVFADWKEALETDEDETKFVLALIDADAVAVDGAEVTSSLRKKFPKIGIIIVATYSQRSDVVRYLRWGTHGVVFKTQPVAEIAAAINVVLSGGLSVPKLTGIPAPQPSPQCLKVHAMGGHEVVSSISLDTDSPPASLARLSERQSMVLELLAQGLPNKAIARKLGLAEATVKAHVNAVFRALNVNNRASAAVLAARASGASTTAE